MTRNELKRCSLVAITTILFVGLLLLVGQRITKRSAEEEANAGGANSKSQRSPQDAESTGAAQRLRALLSGGQKVNTSFVSIEAAARKLSDEELHALIAEVWPLGVEGYAGWVRCALFAEWGRRDPEGALAFLEDPPLLPEPHRHWNHPPEEAPQLFSVFRGWGEVDPQAALARLSMWQLEWITPWHEAAAREILRELARRDGMNAWEKVPVEWGRGGALQGLFRGLDHPKERLAAVNRWLPEKDVQQGVPMLIGLGYRLGPKSLEKEKFRAQSVRAKSDFFFGAALALGELDLAMAVAWVRENSSAAKERVVSAFLWRWAAEFPDKAQAELQAGRHSADDLYMGLIRGDPRRAPELITRIDDPAKRSLVFELGIRYSPLPHENVWGYYPTAHDPPERPELGADYQALKKAIERGGFEEAVASSFQKALNSKYFKYRQAVGLKE